MQEKATPQLRLAAAIRARLEYLKYTQEGPTDAIGMHRAYYGKIELGKKNLTLATLVRLAEGLKTDVATLAKQAGI